MNREGHLSIGKRSSNAQEIQKAYLEEEGIHVDEKYNVDLSRFRA